MSRNETQPPQGSFRGPHATPPPCATALMQRLAWARVLTRVAADATLCDGVECADDAALNLPPLSAGALRDLADGSGCGLWAAHLVREYLERVLGYCVVLVGSTALGLACPPLASLDASGRHPLNRLYDDAQTGAPEGVSQNMAEYAERSTAGDARGGSWDYAVLPRRAPAGGAGMVRPPHGLRASSKTPTLAQIEAAVNRCVEAEDPTSRNGSLLAAAGHFFFAHGYGRQNPHGVSLDISRAASAHTVDRGSASLSFSSAVEDVAYFPSDVLQAVVRRRKGAMTAFDRFVVTRTYPGGTTMQELVAEPRVVRISIVDSIMMDSLLSCAYIHEFMAENPSLHSVLCAVRMWARTHGATWPGSERLTEKLQARLTGGYAVSGVASKDSDAEWLYTCFIDAYNRRPPATIEAVVQQQREFLQQRRQPTRSMRKRVSSALQAANFGGLNGLTLAHIAITVLLERGLLRVPESLATVITTPGAEERDSFESEAATREPGELGRLFAVPNATDPSKLDVHCIDRGRCGKILRTYVQRNCACLWLRDSGDALSSSSSTESSSDDEHQGADDAQPEIAVLMSMYRDALLWDITGQFSAWNAEGDERQVAEWVKAMSDERCVEGMVEELTRFAMFDAVIDAIAKRQASHGTWVFDWRPALVLAVRAAAAAARREESRREALLHRRHMRPEGSSDVADLWSDVDGAVDSLRSTDDASTSLDADMDAVDASVLQRLKNSVFSADPKLSLYLTRGCLVVPCFSSASVPFNLASSIDVRFMHTLQALGSRTAEHLRFEPSKGDVSVIAHGFRAGVAVLSAARVNGVPLWELPPVAAPALHFDSAAIIAAVESQRGLAPVVSHHESEPHAASTATGDDDEVYDDTMCLRSGIGRRLYVNDAQEKMRTPGSWVLTQLWSFHSLHMDHRCALCGCEAAYQHGSKNAHGEDFRCMTCKQYAQWMELEVQAAREAAAREATTRGPSRGTPPSLGSFVAASAGRGGRTGGRGRGAAAAGEVLLTSKRDDAPQRGRGRGAAASPLPPAVTDSLDRGTCPICERHFDYLESAAPGTSCFKCG